jgi:hypothetical protein
VEAAEVSADMLGQLSMNGQNHAPSNVYAHISQFGEAQFWHFDREMPGIYIPPASLPAARLCLEKPLAQHIAARQVFEQRCRCIGAMEPPAANSPGFSGFVSVLR